MRSICDTCGRCNGTQFRTCGIWEPWWRKRWGNLMTVEQIRAREAYLENLRSMQEDTNWKEKEGAK